MSKILYVITKASWGGAQVYVHDLAIATKERGHDVAVAYGTPGELVARLDSHGVRTIEVPGLSRDVRARSDAGAFGALFTCIRNERPDVIHVNSAKAAGLGAFAARIARVPHIIFTAHGWAFNEERPAWQKLLIRFFSGLTVYLSHKTICVSHAVRRDIAWLPFSTSKAEVVHNGITCAPLLPRDEAQEKLAPGMHDRVWIGMLSELHPTKRIVDAIFAVRTIVQTHPNALLVILGEGEERSRLEQTIQTLGLAEHVRLAGFVPNGPSYLQAFDVFLHTSASEALGYAVLEAGCASLPTVATRVGGIPEIITDGESGLLVPPREPHKLAEALLKVLDDAPLREKLGAALNSTVTSKFSKQIMIDRTLGVYGLSS